VLVVWALDPIVVDETTFAWAVTALLVSAMLLWRVPLAFAAVIAFTLLVNHRIIEQDGAISLRSFFGVSRVFDTADGQFRLLQHGTTLHGGQRLRQPNANRQPSIRRSRCFTIGTAPPFHRRSRRCGRGLRVRCVLPS